MNMFDKSTLRRTQMGLSIVELMVAMALGLLLMTGVVQVFLSSRQTYAANEAMGRMQENGRFALEFVARSARLAGYVEPVFQGARPIAIVSPSCAGLPSNAPPELCTKNDVDTGRGILTDSVSFIFQPPVTDNERRDCLGRNLAEPTLPNPENRLVVNNYFIDNNVSPGVLKCRTYSFVNTPAQSQTAMTTAEIISGVDSLQVLYGINTSGDARSADQYVSADRVTNWNNVRAVRIAVLANSIEPITPAPAARNFVLLDASPVSINDNRARQIFSTTIQLKNTF